MLKNGQTYFKNLAVWTFCFNIINERVNIFQNKSELAIFWQWAKGWREAEVLYQKPNTPVSAIYLTYSYSI